MRLIRLMILPVALLVFFSSVQAGWAQNDLLQKIKERGVMRVCQASYPPYNAKNPKTNKWEGLNVDIINAVAKELGVKIENVDCTFATLIASISTGKCDVSAAATYITPGRAEQVLYTKSFSSDTKTAFVRINSPYHSLADLDKPGIVIASRAGTSEAVYAKQYFKKATIKLTTSGATEAHLLEVAAGRANAAFAGYAGGLIFIRENPNLKLRPVGGVRLDPTPFAFMLPLGAYHFQQYLDIAMNQLARTGELKKITDHWLTAP